MGYRVWCVVCGDREDPTELAEPLESSCPGHDHAVAGNCQL